MALIQCPECGNNISDKAVACPHCGCPSSEWKNTEQIIHLNESDLKEDSINRIIKEIVGRYPITDKVKMIRDLREEAGMDLKGASGAIDSYLYLLSKKENKEDNGVYRYTSFGKIKVYCPRCKSENCSYIQEQTIKQGETQTRYTKNLNPLRPFTLANKKEKVISEDRTITKSKLVCNSCSNIFD